MNSLVFAGRALGGVVGGEELIHTVLAAEVEGISAEPQAWNP